MVNEVVGTERRRKRTIRCKLRFTNYDKYDRREAIKKFLDASY